MTMSALPSDHLVAIRDRCKRCLATGLNLSPDETAQFIRRLNTIVELTKEVEHELRISELTNIAAQTWIKNRQDADQACGQLASAAILPFRRPNLITIEGDRA